MSRREAERAARLLKRMQKRVNSLEETVGRDDGLPNLLETQTDRADGQEATAQTVEAVEHLTWDEEADSWDDQQWGH